MKIKFIITFVFCFLLSSTKAQLLDSFTLDTLTAFTNLQEALKTPDKVYKLDLRKQKLKEFPLEILKFSNLQYLDIGKNSLKELPQNIDTLQYLQVLIANKNKIESIPSSLCKLKNLSILNLSNNDFSNLPANIGNLENLQQMDLWSTNLENFPESMSNLKKLRSLDLRVILIPQDQQNRIKVLLPNTIIHFSPACQCKW